MNMWILTYVGDDPQRNYQRLKYYSVLRDVFKRVRKTAKSDHCVRHVCPNVRPPARNNSAHTGRIIVKFYYLRIFSDVCRKEKKIEIYWKLRRIAGNLREHLCTIFFITSRWILFGMRNFTDKIYEENQNTHFMFNISPPRENDFQLVGERCM